MSRFLTNYRLRLLNLLHCEHHAVTRHIVSATALAIVTHVLVRGAAMGKDLLLASAFGTSESIVALLLAFATPALLMNAMGATFATAFVPAYVAARQQQGRAAAADFAGNILGLAAIVLLLAVVVLVATAGAIVPLISRNLPPDQLQLTARILRIFAPLLLAAGASSILGAILNAERQIVLPALAYVALPLATIAAILASRGTNAIEIVAWGMTIGFYLEAAILLFFVGRGGVANLPLRIRLDHRVKRVLRDYGPQLCGAILMSASLLIDPSMAASTGPRSVAALSYGTKLVALITSVGGLSLTAAIFPHFAQMVVARDWSRLRHMLKTQLLLLVAFSAPIAAVLCIGSEQLVRWLYERGEFTAQDTLMVAQVQSAFALQIPFYLACIVGQRLVSSMSCNAFIFWLCWLNFTVNIAGNYLFRHWLGVPGIALSTSVVYMIGSLVTYAYLWNKLNRLERAEAKPGRAGATSPAVTVEMPDFTSKV